ncbi:LOW QUALITY PROTEIN: uncharacterized protein RCH25_048852 [Pelodytes ibericus]
MSDQMPDKVTSDGLYQPPRSLSPTGSVTYTHSFIIENPGNRGAGENPHPVIRDSAGISETKTKCQLLKSKNPPQVKSGLNLLGSHLQNKSLRPTTVSKPEPRSTSMPFIERISRSFMSSHPSDFNSYELLAISDRGIDGGCCVKVLREEWQLLKVLGLKDRPGPTLYNPWGVCIENEGGVLVAYWAQKQAALNQVEEEHRRLWDQLTSIQKMNELALQDGVSEINSIVHEIALISQLKQALGTSNNSPVMKEIRDRVSNIFKRRKSVSLRKVYFSPHPFVSCTLGEIQHEEQVVGFSIPCPKRKRLADYDRTKSPVLLSDEKPPWEQTSQSSDDLCVGVKILLDDQSDLATETGSWLTYLAGEKGDPGSGTKMTVSPREEAVKEADNAALSPRTATKIWITDIKQNVPREWRLLPRLKKGNFRSVSSGQIRNVSKPLLMTSKRTPKEFPAAKPSRLFVKTQGLSRESTTNSRTSRMRSQDEEELLNPSSRQGKMDQFHLMRNRNKVLSIHTASQETKRKDIKEKIIQHGNKRKPISSKRSGPENPSDKSLSSMKTSITRNGDKAAMSSDHNTLFRATAADVPEVMMEEEQNGRDPRAFRELAIRDSRVPSAKQDGDGEQLGRKSDQMPDKVTSDGLYQPPRSLSPTGSVTSTHTFIIETPGNRGASENPHPVIRDSAKISETKTKCQLLKSKNPPQVKSGLNLLGSHLQNKSLRPTTVSKPEPRSTSMPFIERISRQISSSRSIGPTLATDRRDSLSSSPSCWSNPRSFVSSHPSGGTRELRVRERSSQHRRKNARPSHQILNQTKCLSKKESDLIDFTLEHRGPNRLVKQFGKFGSGRAELNLPHGIHTTSTGTLHIVDYGNRRLQVMDVKDKVLQQIVLEAKNYFDVAVNNGLIALTNSTDRTVEVYNKHGRFLQIIYRNWGAPRGIKASYQDTFIVVDMRLGSIWALTLDSSTGRQKECTMIPGLNKPYLVDSNSYGLLAISERGIDGGCCVKVLGEDWQLLKVLGLKDRPGPTLHNPWGVCIDNEGGVLVADWAQQPSIIYYPPRKPAQVIITEGLSSPRGLAMWQECLLLVADSMHNCIKVFQYQEKGEGCSFTNTALSGQ